MEDKTEEVEIVDKETMESKLKSIAKAIKDARETATPALAQNFIKDLFDLVPDLECIQRDARQRVTETRHHH